MTFEVDLCGVAIKEDRSGVVGERHRGGDSGLVLRELHTVNHLSGAVEGQHCVVQLHHSRETKWRKPSNMDSNITNTHKQAIFTNIKITASNVTDVEDVWRM